MSTANSLITRFKFTQLHNQDQGGKRIILQGTISGQPALLIAERGNFDTDPAYLSSFARLVTQVERFSGQWVLRYDPNNREISQLSAEVRVDVPHASLFGRYDDLLAVGSDRLRRGLDALVGPAASPGTQRAQFLTAGTQATLGFGLGVRYEAIVQPQARSESPLSQQTLGVSYAPACNCWRVEGQARLARGQARPDFGLSLTVTGVGTFGTGG